MGIYNLHNRLGFIFCRMPIASVHLSSKVSFWKLIQSNSKHDPVPRNSKEDKYEDPFVKSPWDSVCPVRRQRTGDIWYCFSLQQMVCLFKDPSLVGKEVFCSIRAQVMHRARWFHESKRGIEERDIRFTARVSVLTRGGRFWFTQLWSNWDLIVSSYLCRQDQLVRYHYLLLPIVIFILCQVFIRYQIWCKIRLLHFLLNNHRFRGSGRQFIMLCVHYIQLQWIRRMADWIWSFYVLNTNSLPRYAPPSTSSMYFRNSSLENFLHYFTALSNLQLRLNLFSTFNSVFLLIWTFFQVLGVMWEKGFKILKLFGFFRCDI